MARTFPCRITTGTTEVSWAGLSPIDGYLPEVKSQRPVGYLESFSTAITAATAAPTFYCKQTITAGMCGRLSGAAAHFQTHIAGAMVDDTSGIASWVQIDGGSTIVNGHDGGVITPLTVGVRERVTSTHTSSEVVYGIRAQALFSNDTPTKTFFARLNVSLPGGVGCTAVFLGDNLQSLGWVGGAAKTVFAAPFALFYQGSTTYYVNCYSS